MEFISRGNGLAVVMEPHGDQAAFNALVHYAQTLMNRYREAPPENVLKLLSILEPIAHGFILRKLENDKSISQTLWTRSQWVITEAKKHA